MKIVLLSFLYEPELGGGAAVVVHQLAHLLVQRSHSVAIITTWKGSSIRTENIDGVKIIRIPPNNLYWVGEKDKQSSLKKIIWQLVDIWNPRIYRLVRQILINENADIVHSHKLRGLSPSIWSAAASVGVKKIIHTCHDFELVSPEGLLMGKVGKLAKEQNLIMGPYQSLRKYFSRRVQIATAPSRFVMDIHQKMGFFKNAKTRIVPNSHGFNVNELRQNNAMLSKIPRKDFPRNFLYLGRLDKSKGIDVLCQAFLRVEDKKEVGVLRISGWGPLEGTLREKYKYQDNIEFTGPVFGDRKAGLFRDSDIFVAPSIAPESFGLVISEAYSYGLPVLATRTGAFSEIVRDGETGFLVAPGSVDELWSAIEKICENNPLRKTMSSNCFDEAKKYTTENLINNYLDIYEALD
jgi:glycosyltransferase involved in cell wall biosynthesis